MLVLFSQLKKYLPNLNADVNEVAQVFTFTGQMIDKVSEVEYQGKKDFLLDLEVRQNRADCFGVYGLARELSAYYNTPLIFPKEDLPAIDSAYQLPIEITAQKAVKRVMAIKLGNIEIKESPKWLKDYLNLYGINSINNLVDLTNYVMIETGFPSHVFDSDLVGDNLVWEINTKFSEFKTLNGDIIDLKRSEDTLLISNGEKPLSLSFIGGGVDAVNSNSRNILLEMAIYEGGLVRRNSRRLNIITEASQRLEKYLDADMLPQAFNMLVNLITDECNAKINSKLFDEYIQPTEHNNIDLRLEKVSQIAGTQISTDFILDTLKSLGFRIISRSEETLVVRKPVNRLDISLEEDCIEEVIRMYGYENIPKDDLSIQITKDTTPSNLILIDHIQNILEANGFDEVRSWVLVDEELNSKFNYENWNDIKVTNSINEEVPFLRQSLGVSLIQQLQTYKKNDIPDIQIFEIGKVFGKNNEAYDEHYSLGLLRDGNNLEDLKLDIDKLLRFFEIDNVLFKQRDIYPKAAHPKSVYSVCVINSSTDELIEVGIIYITNKFITTEAVIAEIDIDKLNNVILSKSVRSVHEIDQKLVSLDVNINALNREDVILKASTILKIQEESVWKWEVIDEFKQEDNQYQFTLRVWYFGLSDQVAKEIHSQLFGI